MFNKPTYESRLLALPSHRVLRMYYAIVGLIDVGEVHIHSLRKINTHLFQSKSSEFAPYLNFYHK